ncbi:hypothetical protein, partial [Comamonas jiangduensis]|uniref:hypothetical protein n=1 Tax=Comamonas jiangduensis TaxID=1194168 RepID=UPI003BF82D97
IRHRSVRPISAKHAQASRFLQQSPLLRAQDAVAVAETESYTRLIALYKALGGGWEAPEAAPQAAAG